MTSVWCCVRPGSPAEDDFNVYADGVRVGRVYQATFEGDVEAWCWFIQVTHYQPGVQYAGQSDTLKGAMTAFEINYRRV
jgi:hypothetical protein